MTTPSTIRRDDYVVGSTYVTDYVRSGVAWGPILCGAIAAAAISLMLFVLGSGMGLASISPWAHTESLAAFTIKTAIWLIIMQWVASAIGGYLTGRLRTKFENIHTDEVLFRDTTHGFMAWALATLLTATVLTSTIATVIGGTAQVTATVTAGAAASGEHHHAGAKPHDMMGDPTRYYVDSLYRSTVPNRNAPTHDVSEETARILAKDVVDGTVSEYDRAYLTRLVATRTDLTEPEAEKRVDEVLAELDASKQEAKQTAETARKNAMHASFYLFISMVIGAFIAGTAAAIGGRHRDQY